MSKKMNKKVKKSWVTALRSGDYIQGQKYLHGNGKYCCLGVLCKIQGWPTGLRTLPREADMQSIGLTVIPKVRVNNIVRGLPVLNDSLDYTFEQIADLIEAQL